MNLETLLSESEIQRQLIKLARGMDEKDWETIESILTPDIYANFGTGDIHGNSAVIGIMKLYLENCGTTQHLLGNILIEIDGDTATSESYVSDVHLGKDTSLDIGFRTLGNYSDTWVKIGGKWRMSKRIKKNRATLGTMSVFKS
jgi:SnoaL-like domain